MINKAKIMKEVMYTNRKNGSKRENDQEVF